MNFLETKERDKLLFRLRPLGSRAFPPSIKLSVKKRNIPGDYQTPQFEKETNKISNIYDTENEIKNEYLLWSFFVSNLDSLLPNKLSNSIIWQNLLSFFMFPTIVIWFIQYRSTIFFFNHSLEPVFENIESLLLSNVKYLIGWAS